MAQHADHQIRFNHQATATFRGTPAALVAFSLLLGVLWAGLAFIAVAWHQAASTAAVTFHPSTVTLG